VQGLWRLQGSLGGSALLDAQLQPLLGLVRRALEAPRVFGGGLCSFWCPVLAFVRFSAKALEAPGVFGGALPLWVASFSQPGVPESFRDALGELWCPLVAVSRVSHIGVDLASNPRQSASNRVNPRQSVWI